MTKQDDQSARLGSLSIDRFRANFRNPVWKTCLLQASALLLLAAVTFHWVFPLQVNDITLYRSTCEHLSHGRLPYIWFPFEYPPMAALVFAGPHLLGPGLLHPYKLYVWCFAIQSSVLAAAMTPAIERLLMRTGVDPAPRIRRYTVLMLVLFPVVVWRYDVFPALATVLAVMCLIDDRPWAAGGWLGVAIAAKLYPIVLLGIFLSYALSRCRVADAARMLASAGVVALLPLVPYLVLGSTAFLSFLRFHKLRGLQVESTAAGWIELASQFGWTTVSGVYDYGAYHIRSPWSAAFLRLQPWVMGLGCVSLTALGYCRMRRDVVRDGKAAVSTVADAMVSLLVLFIVANKVFSPQYLVWVAPFVPMLGRRAWRWTAAASVCTSVLFGAIYTRLLSFQMDAVLLLNVRNALLAGVLFMLAAGRRSDRSAKPSLDGAGGSDRHKNLSPVPPQK